ncbi:MAG: hypothetical protein JW917_00855 [Ignavibacteria bacterium]|nr:hypothetical protein [Ignavibacteria bacterium]
MKHEVIQNINNQFTKTITEYQMKNDSIGYCIQTEISSDTKIDFKVASITDDKLKYNELLELKIFVSSTPNLYINTSSFTDCISGLESSSEIIYDNLIISDGNTLSESVIFSIEKLKEIYDLEIFNLYIVFSSNQNKPVENISKYINVKGSFFFQ